MSDELELQPLSGDAPVVSVNPIPGTPGIGGASVPAGEPIGGPELPADSTESGGSDLQLAELDAAGIVAQTFTLVQRRFLTLLGISAAITIPVKLCFLVFILSAALLPAVVPVHKTGDAGSQIVALVLSLLLFVGGALVVYALVALGVVLPLISGATIYTLASEFLGESPEKSGVGPSIAASFRRLLPLIGTALLGTVLTLIGYCLLIVPGIYLTITFWFAACCVMLENRSGWSALKRSGELMAGNFGTALLLGILTVVVQGTVNKSARELPTEALQWFAATLGELAVNLCVSAATVVFYFSCRCKLERFNLDALREGMKSR